MHTIIGHLFVHNIPVFFFFAGFYKFIWKEEKEGEEGKREQVVSIFPWFILSTPAAVRLDQPETRVKLPIGVFHAGGRDPSTQTIVTAFEGAPGQDTGTVGGAGA